jgi:hypothetical protein
MIHKVLENRPEKTWGWICQGFSRILNAKEKRIDAGCSMPDKIKISSLFTGQTPKTGIKHLFHKGTTWSNKKVLPKKAQNLQLRN